MLQDKISVVSLEVMRDEGRVGIFLGEEPLAEFIFGVGAQEHFLVAAFILDYTEIGDMPSIVLGTLEIKKHQVLVLFIITTITVYSNIVVKEFVIGARLGCLWISHFDRLNVALMVLRLYVFLAHSATNKATVMIIDTLGDHTLTPLAFGRGGTEGFLLTAGIFMSGEALITFKETIAVLAKGAIDNGTVLRMAQLTQISARMVGDLVVAFLALMAILFPGKEGWHTCDHVIVIVVMIEVKTLVSLLCLETFNQGDQVVGYFLEERMSVELPTDCFTMQGQFFNCIESLGEV